MAVESIFEGLISLFVVIVLAWALGPVLMQLSPNYSWIFYIGIIAAILAILASLFKR